MIRATLGLLGMALLVAAPAAGDWLVLRDGSRLETDGPWKVKGRQVVFTRPGGTLAALRLADVDLEASAEATEASQAAAAAPPPPAEPAPAASATTRRRKSVLVLTDDDLRPGGAGVRARAEGESADDEEAGAGQAGREDGDDDQGDGDEGEDSEGGDEPAAAVGEPVTIVSWQGQEGSEIDGLEILGSVRNTGHDIVAAIQVRVRVVDEEGNVQADARAFLESPSLGPGRSSNFRALLPGIYSLLETPTFEVTSEVFTLGLVDEVESGEDDEFDYEDDEFADPADEFDYEDDEFAEPGDERDEYAEPYDDLEALDEGADEEVDDDESGGGSGLL